jgi:hypothetical protein
MLKFVNSAASSGEYRGSGRVICAVAGVAPENCFSSFAKVSIFAGLPILIGDGLRFFEKLDRDVALHLAEIKAYKSGTVELRYDVRGCHDESRGAST